MAACRASRRSPRRVSFGRARGGIGPCLPGALRAACCCTPSAASAGRSATRPPPSTRPPAGTSYACCTFRGSIIALDAATGEVKWQHFTTPDNGGATGGWSGSAVWGSAPLIDRARRQVVVATGDNYE